VTAERRTEGAAASVVIPTIGRVDELAVTLEALASCNPPADEVVVVDQGSGEEVGELVGAFATTGTRRIASTGRGVALAANEGLRAARHETVLFTDDDCTVDRGWVGTGCALRGRHPGCVFTGRVLPMGDAGRVPTTALGEAARDFTGDLYSNVLVRSNMVCTRSQALAIGGFDERFETSAEDDDFGYRWLKSGRCLRYEPALLVWHRGWRAEHEVRERFERYGREQAWFYAKHLRAGDPRVLRFLARDLRDGLRGSLAAVLRRGAQGHDPRRSVARGVLVGLPGGWRGAALNDSAPRGTPPADGGR
jgi:GT2 family glycosyltransferase